MSEPGKASKPERRVAGALNRLDGYRRLHGQQLPLGTAVFRILWLLSDDRSRTMRELEHELSLEQSTVNRQVNASIADGLLEKARRPGRAAYEFSRTEKGRAEFERGVAVWLGPFEAALDAMGPADAAAFLDLFDRFVGAYRDAVSPN